MKKTNHLGHRLLSLVLALAMVLGMLSTTAFAQGVLAAIVIDIDDNETEHCTTLTEALVAVKNNPDELDGATIKLMADCTS